ncbi:MAG TPA: hypothetical protein VLS93_02540, partial [Anaeromyxobacteraceae bacterium]|nr:hypothetical protein [Anaeromyxobacteraceae bacterium]
MPPPDGRRGRAMLGAWLLALFAISAVSDLRLLAGLGAGAAVLLRRGFVRSARRALRSAVPLAGGLALASWAWLRLVAPSPPAWEPFLALGLRAVLAAFVTFAALERVDLFRALAPWPLATRLLVVTL